MSERYEQPQNRDRESREVMLAAMSVTEGRTPQEIAKAIGKSDATVSQMLGPLRMDGCVKHDGAPEKGRAWKWLLTGNPLPEKFTSTCDYRDSCSGGDGPRFDDRALCEAMGLARAAFGGAGPTLSGRALGARLVRGAR